MLRALSPPVPDCTIFIGRLRTSRATALSAPRWPASAVHGHAARGAVASLRRAGRRPRDRRPWRRLAAAQGNDRRRRHRRPLHSDHAAQRGLRRVDLREDARVPLLRRPHPDREQRPRGRTLTRVDTASALASGSTARPALPQPWARALPCLLGSGPSPLVLGSVASPFEATPQPSKGRPRICAPTRSWVRCI